MTRPGRRVGGGGPGGRCCPRRWASPSAFVPSEPSGPRSPGPSGCLPAGRPGLLCDCSGGDPGRVRESVNGSRAAQQPPGVTDSARGGGGGGGRGVLAGRAAGWMLTWVGSVTPVKGRRALGAGGDCKTLMERAGVQYPARNLAPAEDGCRRHSGQARLVVGLVGAATVSRGSREPGERPRAGGGPGNRVGSWAGFRSAGARSQHQARLGRRWEAAKGLTCCFRRLAGLGSVLGQRWRSLTQGSSGLLLIFISRQETSS